MDLAIPPSTLQYLRDVWRRREFAIVIPAQDLRAQNMDNVLGQLWHLVNPALLVGVYFVVFGVVLNTDRGVDNFFAFLVIGVVLFHLTQRVAQDASVAISRNQGLIRSVQFPRILLPISAVNGQTIAFLPALVVAAVAVLVTGERPTLRWLALLAVIAAQYLFNLGMAFIVARVGASIRDLRDLIPHLFRLLFYGSGVIFSVEAFVSSTKWKQAFSLNPVYDILSCARWCLLGMPVEPEVVAGTVAWAIVLPVAGFIAFRRSENRFGI